MKRYSVILILILAVLLSGCKKKPTGEPKPGNTFATEGLQIHTISIGKADAILILADGEAMLIDAGYTDQGKTVVDYLKKQGVAELKYLVMTHADKDHVGGMAEVIDSIPIRQALLSPKKENSPEYATMVRALTNSKTPYSFPELLSTFSLGKATFTVLAPGPKALDAGTDNDSSIVLRMVYGERTALLMGDALSRTEKEMREKGYDVSAEVLKVGHHGKGDATTKKFVREVAPLYAIITCEQADAPDKDVLSVLRSFSADVLRTDEKGTVILSTDGTKWEVKTER